MMMMENIVLHSKQGRNDMKVQNTPQKFLNSKENWRLPEEILHLSIRLLKQWIPPPMQFPQEPNAGKRKSRQTEKGIISWKEISQF